MAKIILACRQKPLAEFFETVLAQLHLECRKVTGRDELVAAVSEFQPDLVLINYEFTAPADKSNLLTELENAGLKNPVVSICEPTEIDLMVSGGELPPETADVLRLPFSKNDLQKKIEKLTGLNLSEKSDPPPEIEKSSVSAEELHKADLQPAASPEKDEDMEKVTTDTVKIFELTEIVEEGLPLSELPERVSGGSLPVEPVEFEEPAESEPGAGEDSGEEITADSDLDFDDFGDSLDDLELDSGETAAQKSVTTDSIGESDAEILSEEPGLPETEVKSKVVLEDETVAAAGATELQSVGESLPPQPVAGDLDALLDDDDFAEVEIHEEDPVLAGLKSAGLTPEVETPEVKNLGSVAEVEAENEPVAASSDDHPTADNLVAGDADDANDYEDLLDGVAAVRSETDGDPLDDETVEFVEMPRPEEVLSPEATLIVPPVAAAAEAAVPQDNEPDIELPEDYLEDEDLLAGTSEPEPKPEPEPEVESQSEIKLAAATLSRMVESPTAAEPKIFTEPQSLDFSQQIEGMTQEWSKQLLQTTYASMDKMIKAIGDLAPTIVNQVAREVIPPLAEKVIKAEIARLEEQLQLEDGEGEEES